MFLSCAQPVIAGEVILVNGDRLTGAIHTIEGGKLQLRSPLLGTVEIEMIHIESISSDEIVTVVLADGRTFSRRLRATAPRTVQLQDAEGRSEQDVPLAEIAAVNPPEKKKPSWTGNMTGGITSIHGNTGSQSLQASLSMARRGESDRISLGADYGRATNRNDATRREETSEDWWKLRGKYDRFFSQQFYGYLEGQCAVDKVAKLDRRIIGGTGGGYQWLESEALKFSTEAGVAYLTEKHQGGDSSDRMTAQASYYLDAKILEKLTFKHNLSYFPSIDRFSDYYLTTTFELRARLSERMFTNFRTIFDYDATPAPGKAGTDIKHILGVGWDF
jgi:putative salt-induced outer membrane protein YdiY